MTNDDKNFFATDLRQAAYMLLLAFAGLLIGFAVGGSTSDLIAAAVIRATVAKVLAFTLGNRK